VAPPAPDGEEKEKGEEEEEVITEEVAMSHYSDTLICAPSFVLQSCWLVTFGFATSVISLF
jgi:hypothetical protein